MESTSEGIVQVEAVNTMIADKREVKIQGKFAQKFGSIYFWVRAR